MNTKIKISGIKKNHLANLVDFFNDERVIFGTAILPLISETDIEKKFFNENTHTILAQLDTKIVGICSLTWGKHRWRTISSLFLAVSSDEHNKGIGKLLTNTALNIAFKYLSMHKVEIEVYSDNPAAIKMYKDIGFVYEGTKRKNAQRDGQYVDGMFFSILNEEWGVEI